jgi:hypothetical protein
MFTIELDTDRGHGITITTLDNSGVNDDVEVILYDDQVFVRQFDEFDGSQMIIMSVQQMKDIVAAMSLPEGAYYQSTSLKGGRNE